LQPNNGTTQLATLYFPALNEIKIMPESRSITWAQADADRVRQIVLALAEGSHQGYGHPLSASTSVRAGILAGDGTAYLDLSNDVLSDFEPGIQSETLAVYSIVNSIIVNHPLGEARAIPHPGAGSGDPGRACRSDRRLYPGSYSRVIKSAL
jgi:hypothetical protein